MDFSLGERDECRKMGGVSKSHQESNFQRSCNIRVRFFKSSIASVHLYTLLIQADRPFERQRNLPFLTQPSAAGEVELTPRARWKVYVQPSGRNAAWRKEDRKAKTTAS